MRTAADNFPKECLKKTTFDGILDVLAVLALLAAAALIVTQWPKLPQNIPYHFNFAGKPDAWGPKGMIVVLPAIQVVIYLVLTAVARRPQRFNIPWEVAAQSAPRQYHIATQLVRVLRLEVGILFLFLVWGTIRVAFQQDDGLGWAFPLVVAGIILGTVAGYLLAGWRSR